MSILNVLLRAVFDVLLAPFRGMAPIVGVVVMSLGTAILMLVVFRVASDQKTLAQVKRRIHACIFEIRLFNDDLRAILRAQMEILRHNLTYVRLTLVPMLWMMVPIILLIAELQFFYAYRGLDPGSAAVLSVVLDEELPLNSKPDITLEVPDGLRMETPSVWIGSRREMSWRLGVERTGEYAVGIVLGGKTYTKSVLASERIHRRSPIRLESGILNQLLYPAEDPLPKDGPIRSISIGYPSAEVDVFGWNLHWMIVYFIVSIVFAFGLKGLFGVTI